MCYQVVERYSFCRCLYYKHTIDPCAAHGQRGHVVGEKTVLVGYSCSIHSNFTLQTVENTLKESASVLGASVLGASVLGASVPSSGEERIALHDDPLVQVLNHTAPERPHIKDATTVRKSKESVKAVDTLEEYPGKLGTQKLGPALSSPIPTNSAPRARATSEASDTSSGYLGSDAQSEIFPGTSSETDVSTTGDLDEENTLSRLVTDLERCELGSSDKLPTQPPKHEELGEVDNDPEQVEVEKGEFKILQTFFKSNLQAYSEGASRENDQKPAIVTATECHSPDGNKQSSSIKYDSIRLQDHGSRKSHQKRNRPSGKRLSPDDNGNDPDGSSSDEDEDRDKKRKRPDIKIPRKRIRCPFYLKDPAKYGAYQACSSGMGFEDMGRLRYHLKRVHTQPFRCQRCQAEMSSKAVLKEHLRSGQRCEVLPEPQDDRISSEQWEIIDGARGCGLGLKSVEEKYTHLYRTIFGPTGSVPSPYERSFLMCELEQVLIGELGAVMGPEIVRICRRKLNGATGQDQLPSASSSALHEELPALVSELSRCDQLSEVLPTSVNTSKSPEPSTNRHDTTFGYQAQQPAYRSSTTSFSGPSTDTTQNFSNDWFLSESTTDPTFGGAPPGLSMSSDSLMTESMSSIEQSLNGFADLPMPAKVGPSPSRPHGNNGGKQSLDEKVFSQPRVSSDVFEDIPDILEGLAVRYNWDDFFGT